MSRRVLAAVIILTLSALACGLPSLAVSTPVPPDAVFTIAAQTVAAELTRAAAQATATPPVPVPTNTPIPTLTPTLPPSPTVTSIPCNQATFVTDVTYDDTVTIPVLSPGQVFVKTWRIRNAGSCTWTSGYQLVFDTGDQMGGPSAVQLTTGTVAPGQTIDISVTLTAPATPGIYQGYWRLRSPEGVLFGTTLGKSWWVKIKVEVPAATATTSPAGTTVNVPLVIGESGQARSDGTFLLSVPNVGDTGTNQGMQAFLSFDISGIPATATITQVSADFSNYDKLGDPWGSLGCLYLYAQNYGTLDAGDYFAGAPLDGLLRWCGDTGISAVTTDNDLKALVQSRLGTSRVQIRAQFPDRTSDADGVADAVRFGPAIKLIVKYTTP